MRKTHSKMTRTVSIAAILAAACAMAAPAGAVTYNWTGAGGNGNWNNDLNWDAPPVWDGTADLVITTNANTVPATVSVNSVTWNVTGHNAWEEVRQWLQAANTTLASGNLTISG